MHKLLRLLGNLPKVKGLAGGADKLLPAQLAVLGLALLDIRLTLLTALPARGYATVELMEGSFTGRNNVLHPRIFAGPLVQVEVDQTAATQVETLIVPAQPLPDLAGDTDTVALAVGHEQARRT